MPITIHIINPFSDSSNSVSAEETAAMQLKDKFEKELSGYKCKGDIFIFTNIRIFGQKRNDIDILVLGNFDDLKMPNMETKNHGKVKELTVKSFIFNIEHKSHDSSGVFKRGTNYYVKYWGYDSDASKQCFEAKFSLLNYFEEQLSLKPFICDILWFYGLTKKDLSDIRGQRANVDNALYSDFSFRELVSALLTQSDVLQNAAGDYVLDNFTDGKEGVNAISRHFSEKRMPKGELTRQKFELLSKNDEEIKSISKHVGEKFTILTGRAGTGKTVQLLQLAFKLAQDYDNRCLILTYNNALVSDIRRLIDYTRIPTKVTGRTVQIKTIHSYFHTLLSQTGIVKELLNPNDSDYDKNYNKYLDDLNTYIIDLCDQSDIQYLLDKSENYIGWDYIFIDEAQDFSDKEKEILFKIYGPNRLIIADGVDQFMRFDKRQEWGKGINTNSIFKPKEMKLERRQKANLVNFVNSFAKLAGIEWSVKPNRQLPGGKVKIYKTYNSNIHKELVEDCKKNKGECYDILILVPPTMVKYDENGSHFANLEKYKEANINIFDGSNPKNRSKYPTTDICRLYQYQSCRGLEGWSVVCSKFDQAIQYKLDNYQSPENELGLDKEKNKYKSIMLWALMPLTRPIDTLVITLSNPDSEVGKILKCLATDYSDFVEWNIK